MFHSSYIVVFTCCTCMYCINLYITFCYWHCTLYMHIYWYCLPVSFTFLFIHSLGYDERTMHGLGFYLGITALNYGAVERSAFTCDQWAELLFAMGVQCQFSCACVASLLAVSTCSSCKSHTFWFPLKLYLLIQITMP